MSDPLQDAETPWRDKTTLEQLYNQKGMTQAEIGERFGVAQKTISRWLDRHDIKPPWRDEQKMRRLYEDKHLSATEIAQEFDTTPSNINKWLHKHGVETRDRQEAARRAILKKAPKQHTTRRGYEYVASKINDERDHIRIHRLIAVAEYGFDVVAENIIHHKNGIPWDNRPENLEPMSVAEHTRLHRPVDIRHGNATPRDTHTK